MEEQSGEWKTDEDVLEFMLDSHIKIHSEPAKDNLRFFVGGNSYTFKEVLEECRKGSEFGRRYYKAMLESIEAHKQEFENYKKNKQ